MLGFKKSKDMNTKTLDWIHERYKNQTCSFLLNVGCGNKLYKYFINIDLHNPKADLRWDLRNPLPCKDNSIDLIYAQHIIEHFTREEWKKVKADWYRVLKPEGILIIECPDIVRCMQRFLNDEEKRWKYWILTIYGTQNEEGQLHKNGFTFEKLAGDLEEEGFDIIDFEYLFDEDPDKKGFNLQVKAIK